MSSHNQVCGLNTQRTLCFRFCEQVCPKHHGWSISNDFRYHNNRLPYQKKSGICGLTGWCWRTRKPANTPSPPWWLWKAWLRWGALAGGGRGPWKRSRPLRWGPWRLTGGPRPRSKSWKIQPPNWPVSPTVSHPKLWPRTSSRISTPLEKVKENTNC